MGDVAGLPALSDPRLTSLQKQSKRIRKGTTILNGRLKTMKDKSNKVVDKNKASEGFRAWQKSMPLKHSLAEIRGLQKCLTKRRESVPLEHPDNTPRNGVYDGAPLDSFRSEVTKIIAEKNPRERRLRKVERVKQNGYRDGRIVDYESSMAKFAEVMIRPKGINRGERAMTTLGYGYSPTSSPYSPTPESPTQFRLPPIQARRSTISGFSTLPQPRRLFDNSSSNSDPSHAFKSFKRSMSFAIAQ